MTSITKPLSLLNIDLFQRKKSILERNKLIQQFSMTSNQECLSPEPIFSDEGKHDMVNSPQTLRRNTLEKNGAVDRDLLEALKPHSRLSNKNGEHTSSSSASGISSPSSIGLPDERYDVEQ